MIYTSYISKLSSIPNDYYKLVITRYNKVDLTNFQNSYHAVMLSPSEELLDDWKNKRINAQDFFDRFLNQVIEDKAAITLLKKILYYDKNDKNVVLLCYEKELMNCHRYLVAKILEKNGGRVEYELQT